MATVCGGTGLGCDSLGGCHAATAGVSPLYGLGRQLWSTIVCRHYDTSGSDGAIGRAATGGNHSGGTTGGGHAFGPSSDTVVYGCTAFADCAATTVERNGGSSNDVGRRAHEQPASGAPTP